MSEKTKTTTAGTTEDGIVLRSWVTAKLSTAFPGFNPDGGKRMDGSKRSYDFCSWEAHQEAILPAGVNRESRAESLLGLQQACDEHIGSELDATAAIYVEREAKAK